MMRYLRVIERAGLLGVLLVTLAGSQPVEKATEPPATQKPPWQRYLQGEDAKKAAKLEKQRAKLQEVGKFAEALRAAEALAELRHKVQGDDHWQTIDTHWQVEALRRADKQEEPTRTQYAGIAALARQAASLESKGRYKKAQPLKERLLAICCKVLGEEHPSTAVGYNNLAFTLNAQGKYREAEEGYRKALALRRKMLGEEHPQTAQSYNNVAHNLYSQGKYREAEEGLRKALAIRRKVLGEQHPDTAESYNNLALNLNAQGKYKEAEKGYRKALAINRKVLGEQHPHTATSYDNLASNRHAQGKYKEAEEGFRKALAIRRKMLGEENPKTALSYNNLAVNQNAQSKYAEAEEGMRKALAIRRKVLGEEHPDTANSYASVAHNLNAQGKYAEAEEGSRKALAICRKVLGEEHPHTATSYNNLAINQNAQGKYQEAEEGLRKALAIYRKVLGEEHPHTAVSYFNLAVNQHAQGKYQEAEESYRKALAIWRKVLGEQHPSTALSYNDLAVNQSAQDKYKEAEKGLRKALAIQRKVLGEEHPDTVTSYNNLGGNQNDQGKYTEAEELWRHAANTFAKARLHIAASGLDRATKTSEKSPLPALAAVLARNGNSEAAWQRFEESLGRGTWDDLYARIHRPADELAKQIELVNRLNRLDQLLEKTYSPKGETAELKKRRDELLTQRRKTQDDLYAFARHLEKTYGPIAGQVFERQQIQAALPPDTALVGWLDIAGDAHAADPNGEHWGVVLRATGDPLWVRLRGSGDKHTSIKADSKLPVQLRTALQSSRGDWRPLAKRLAEQRLKPLAKHLKGVRRLIVLPSTALAGVPVEVFADGYTVSYAHSGTMYAHLRKQDKPESEGLFALADPVFDLPKVVEKQRPLPPGGVLLTMVLPRSNAAQAELKPGDVLLRYGNSDLSGPKDLKPLPPSNDPEQRVGVTVWREGLPKTRATSASA